MPIHEPLFAAGPHISTDVTQIDPQKDPSQRGRWCKGSNPSQQGLCTVDLCLSA